MKKIVGILAVAALFATSVFASDISAATKIEGTIFSYGTDKKVELLTEKNGSQDWANPNFSMSVSGENAGATVTITTQGDDTPKQTTQTIWFKPIDALKITVGNYDVALNKEQIDWTESVTGLGGNGYLLSIGASGFALDFGIEANGNYWITKADGADAVLNPFFFKVGYSADFGNIGAFAKITLTPAKAATAAKTTYVLDPEAGVVPVVTPATEATSASKSILFGAGYRNNFSGVDAFLNVVGSMGEKFDWIRPELYASGSADAFGYALFVAPRIYTNKDLNQKTDCELLAKVSYSLDGITPYAYFKSANLLADTFAATVKLGASGSVGAMGWNTWLQLDIADKTGISIPVEFTIGL